MSTSSARKTLNYTKPSAQTHLLGWQGLTLEIPENWNIASFKGTHLNGQIRVDDEDSMRLEIRWETPGIEVDIEKSVDKLCDAMAKDAKKRKDPYDRVEKPLVVAKSRKRKERVTNFGWVGDRDGLAGQGWGVSWQCPDCKRVVIGHVIGRGEEKPDRVREQAGRILETLECHGQGGWETWSVFDLRVDIPEEFQLERAKLVTGRLELDWVRGKVGGPFSLFRHNERLSLMRFSLAALLLQHETLGEWAERIVRHSDKKFRYNKLQETTIKGRPGIIAAGALRDVRKMVVLRVLDKLRRREGATPALRIWHDEDDNKLWVLKSDIAPQNSHVIDDVLDSLP